MGKHHGIPINNEAQGEKNLTAMAVEFVGYQRFFAIYRHTCAIKLRVYQDMVASCVAEHGGRILKLVNDGATAYFFDADEAVKSAIRMNKALQKHNNAIPDQDRISFAVFLHHGLGIVQGEEIIGTLAGALTTMRNMPGKQDSIYASDSVVTAVGATKGIEYGLVDSLNKHMTVHEVRWGEDVDLDARESVMEAQFQYRRALVEGIHEPCFYCGSRRHSPSGCPSKHLPEQNQSFRKLGLLSVRQLNNLFSDAISRGLDKVRHKWEQNEDVPDTYFDAYHGFYDIKRVFQLRFGRVPMSYGGNDWEKATEISAQNDGGRIWVALDHLRTGDMSRAETLLKELYEENPQAFRTNLALGYLNIEQGGHRHALDYFEAAHKYAATRPQKILALLLVCRIHYLYLNNMEAAKEQLRLIRKIDGHCPEALYQDIVLQMKSEGEATPIRQLASLIASYPEYYLVALIDPDLISVQTALINGELGSMLANAREHADRSLKESGSRMERVESWLGEDDQKARDLREKFLMVKTCHDSGSFQGYLDTACKSPSVITECNKVEIHSAVLIKSMLGELHDRLYPLVAYFNERREAGPAGMLAAIQSDIADFEECLRSSLPHKDAVARHKEISENLLKVEEIVATIEKRRAVVSRLTGFVRKTVIFFFAITLAGVVLLVAGQHASLQGIGLLPIFLDHRGSVLFGACIASLIMSAAIECYKLGKGQGSAQRPGTGGCRVKAKET